MPKPGECKTVHADIQAYAQDIDWAFIPLDEAEQWREERVDWLKIGHPAKYPAKMAGGSIKTEMGEFSLRR